MDLNLKDKVTIVTGAAQGIGKAIAESFASEGASVALVDVNAGGVEKAAEEIRSCGVQAIGIRTDITSPQDTNGMVRTVLDAFLKVDILVNNAGLWVLKSFRDSEPEDWQREIAVNYYGVLNCTKAVLGHMIERGRGRIVNMASDAGRIGEPDHPTYSASKAAVIAFTKALAKDVGPEGIAVNAVAPGWTDTPSAWKFDAQTTERILKRSYPLRKVGRPQDIADMVLFLSSERAGHVTGQTISVDGGYCML